MTIVAAGDSDQFEAELARRQARARRVHLVVTLVLLCAGALCGALALLLALPVREHPGPFAALFALGLILAVAGCLSALQLRGGAGLEVADDVLGRLTPRILGGKKPGQLDSHQRPRRGRRGRG